MKIDFELLTTIVKETLPKAGLSPLYDTDAYTIKLFHIYLDKDKEAEDFQSELLIIFHGIMMAGRYLGPLKAVSSLADFQRQYLSAKKIFRKV